MEVMLLLLLAFHRCCC